MPAEGNNEHLDVPLEEGIECRVVLLVKHLRHAVPQIERNFRYLKTSATGVQQLETKLWLKNLYFLVSVQVLSAACSNKFKF